MGVLIKWIIGIGIIYYILSRFIFPVFRITMFANKNMQQMQDKIREMEQKMNQTPAPSQKSNKKKDGDYIDYEEVK